MTQTTRHRHRRPPEGLPLLIALEPGSGEPLFRQVYRFLRDAILDGRLAPGLRLPSTRTLAMDLDVSRNTVVAAFEQLHAEGYLDSRVGHGTRVAQSLPEYFGRASRRRTVPAPPAVQVRARPSERAVRIAAVAAPRSLLSGEAPSFRPGLPALDRFPLALWQRLVAQRARVVDPDLLSYAGPLGYAPLRRALAQYLRVARGLRCAAEQVFVVAGTQQALRLSGEVALDAGDVALVEDPGYHGATGALTAAGARMVGVPVDGEGLDIRAAREIAPQARMACVTPSHQFPLGVTMSVARRLELLEWARTTGAWIVEDDYDSEFRYVSRPLTALAGLDESERVIYCGSFSKVLFPGLRLGYVVVPAPLVEPFAAARLVADTHRATFEQVVLAEFIEEGHFERHVRRMQVLYRERRDVLIDCLTREFGSGVRLGGQEAGMHLVLWLADGIDAREVQHRAAGRGIDAIPVSAFAIDRAVPPGLVLGYTHMDTAWIQRACRALAEVVKGCTGVMNGRK